MDTPLLLTVRQAAKLASIGRSTAYALCRSGEWPVVRFGSAIRIPRKHLEEWISKQTHSID